MILGIFRTLSAFEKKYLAIISIAFGIAITIIELILYNSIIQGVKKDTGR